MKKTGYYSTGEFMKLAHITKKTVRYYDEHNILKPSYVDPETGSRFYTAADLAHLQQILLLKALGFSLGDIRELTINVSDSHFMSESLELQQKLVEDRIEQLQVVAQTIQETALLINEHKSVDWSHMLELIHNLGMESRMKNQYQNASNISARINLHSLYSQNHQGWFPWICEQCHLHAQMDILELGCGDGSFWKENLPHIPADITIVLSDISEGMLRDTRRALTNAQNRFTFECFGCEAIPYPDNSFDLILANHVLFYCQDIATACAEIRRVLRPGGVFLCSAYGHTHMQEISRLVAAFDDRITLSAQQLYERFGKENGSQLLAPFFTDIQWMQYEDHLLVPEADPLISYVLSCHGNQNQYILDHYKEFRTHVKNRIGKGFYITKDAGIYICR